VVVVYISLPNHQQSQILRKLSARNCSITIKIEARTEISNKPGILSSEKNLLVGWATEDRLSVR
jgi:hypothetical protein